MSVLLWTIFRLAIPTISTTEGVFQEREASAASQHGALQPGLVLVAPDARRRAASGAAQAAELPADLRH